MKIGIIGAGEIGSALARNFVRAGHSVKIANSRRPETLAKIAADTGAAAVELAEVVRNVDLIVLAVPFGKIAELDKALFADLPAETVIVETGNYSPGIRDARNEAIEAGMTETNWVSEHVGRPVIKAYNALISKVLRSGTRKAGHPERIAVPVAGNDARAKRLVMDLVEQTGFDAVDAGAAEESWRQQLGSPVASAVTFDRAGMIEGLAQADRQRVTAAREKLLGLVQSGVIDPYA